MRDRARTDRTRRSRERRRLVAPLVLAVALVGAGTWVLTGARQAAGPAAPRPLSLPPRTTSTTTTPAVEASSGIAPAPIATSDALLAANATTSVVVPTSVRVERAGSPDLVDTVVTPVGVDARGDVAVPPDVSQGGWYRFGPTPGAPGSAVVVAHVDYDGRQGPFFRLATVRPGDVVVVEMADASVVRFAVTQTGSYRKDQLPTPDLFRTDGPAQLVLITCGGEFSEARRSYADNVVVLATPLP